MPCILSTRELSPYFIHSTANVTVSHWQTYDEMRTRWDFLVLMELLVFISQYLSLRIESLCLHDTDRSVVVVILCLKLSCSPCSISCLLMPRNSHKKRLLDPNKSQLLFVEAPINGPKHDYGPQLRSAIHPKSFISEKQQRSGAPCSSWVCACFAWCEDERRCFNWN